VEADNPSDAQSRKAIRDHRNECPSGRVRTEIDALDSNLPKAMTKTLAAIRTLESIVLNAQDVAGIVLRYGSFYGQAGLSWA